MLLADAFEVQHVSGRRASDGRCNTTDDFHQFIKVPCENRQLNISTLDVSTKIVCLRSTRRTTTGC